MLVPFHDAHHQTQAIHGMSPRANTATPATGEEPADTRPQRQGLARKAQILAFLVRYRNAGVFSFEMDQTALEGLDPDDTKGGDPERFVADLEALGPTFVKLGQSLSTRPAMVPPQYLQALSRMPGRVSPRRGGLVAGV